MSLSFLYCRISKGWILNPEEKNKWLGKLGSTEMIENRKWQASTERTYPSDYKWFITIKNLGRFPYIVSAEKTVYRLPFFRKRRSYNGIGSGTEFYKFNDYDDPLKKICELLSQYDVIFEITIGDPFFKKPQKIFIETLKDAKPLSLITHTESKKLEIRKYQLDIISKMLKTNLGTIIMATGLGKTVVFSLYIKKRMNGRYLIVVPTKELINQTINTCNKIIGQNFIYMKFNKNIKIPDTNNIIIIGTYQNSHNLQKIQNINCIIFDECHCTVVLNHNKINDNKFSRFQLLLKYNCTKFFFTATEKNLLHNGDEISMDNTNIYGKILYRYELDQAIINGYLTDYCFHLIATNDKFLSTKQYIEKGFKTIVFCSCLNTVDDVYTYLKNNLSKNVCVLKLGKYDDLNINLQLFSNHIGKAIIVACQKIKMGYDEPQIDTVIHYDISISSIMTIQRNGRALRLHDDKVMATLVFLCDISGDENSRKEEIKKLQRPILYLKSIDNRLTKRIEKELMKSDKEFKTVNIKVENFDNKIKDSRQITEIYNSCWKILCSDKNLLNYEYQKCININKRLKILTSYQYTELVQNQQKLIYDNCILTINEKLIPNPDEYFKEIWNGWYNFLGLEKELQKFIQTKDEWKKCCNNLGITSRSDYVNIQPLYSQLPSMPEEFYSNFTNFDDEIGKKIMFFKHIVKN